MSNENKSEKQHPSSTEENQAAKQEQQPGHVANKWQKIIEESDKEKDQGEAKDQEAQVDAAASLEFTTRNELENQLTAIEMKCEEYKNQMQRVQAELANIQKRSQRDVENAYKYSNEKIIMALLPVVDSLNRALETAINEDDSKQKAMQEGVKLIFDLLLNTLKKFGVAIIDPAKGEAFNPEHHEAVSTQSDSEVGPHCIVSVLQKGYQLNDRVLRAAMVVVSPS